MSRDADKLKGKFVRYSRHEGATGLTKYHGIPQLQEAFAYDTQKNSTFAPPRKRKGIISERELGTPLSPTLGKVKGPTAES